MTRTIIDVELGKTFHIKVEATPSTGYVWAPVYDKEFLNLLGEEFERTSNAIGGGGILEFSFLALRTGKTDIALQLRRPWEADVAETRYFEIEIL